MKTRIARKGIKSVDGDVKVLLCGWRRREEGDEIRYGCAGRGRPLATGFRKTYQD